MPINRINKRIILKRDDTGSISPSIGPSEDHTDGSWDKDDIYPGELFVDLVDSRTYVGYENSVSYFVDESYLTNNYYNKTQIDNTFLDKSVGGTIDGDIEINGDLQINGDATSIETTNLAIKDNIIIINSGETEDGISLGEAGILIDRGDYIDYKIVFDESDDKLKAGLEDDLKEIAFQEDVDSLSSQTYENKDDIDTLYTQTYSNNQDIESNDQDIDSLSSQTYQNVNDINSLSSKTYNDILGNSTNNSFIFFRDGEFRTQDSDGAELIRYDVDTDTIRITDGIIVGSDIDPRGITIKGELNVSTGAYIDNLEVSDLTETTDLNVYNDLDVTNDVNFGGSFEVFNNNFNSTHTLLIDDSLNLTEFNNNLFKVNSEVEINNIASISNYLSVEDIRFGDYHKISLNDVYIEIEDTVSDTKLSVGENIILNSESDDIILSGNTIQEYGDLILSNSLNIGDVNINSNFYGYYTWTSEDIDWSDDRVRIKTLSSNETWTFSNLQAGKTISVYCSGDYSITLPSSVKNISGSYDGGTDNLLIFHCVNDNGGDEVIINQIFNL